MIISKLVAAEIAADTLQKELSRLLTQPRGCAAARIEAMHRREKANKTGICPGCNGPLYNSPKLDGWCRTCSSKLDRMASCKSALCKGHTIRSKRILRFVDDYSAMLEVPYTLHGDMPPSEVLRVAREYTAALLKVEALKRDRKLRMIEGLYDEYANM